MANLTFDTAYNRAIAERVVLEGADNSWQPDHFIYGGIAKRSHILSGNTPYVREASFDTVGGRRMEMPQMAMVRPIGGRKGKTVKTMDALSSIIPKKVRKALVNQAVEAIESPIGGISYTNKASKWLEIGKQLIPKKIRRAATDKAVEGIESYGGISYTNKASKWLEIGKQLIPKKVRRAATDKAVEMIEGAGKGMSKAKARGMLVSAAMREHGLSLGDASRYVKEQQMK